MNLNHLLEENRMKNKKNYEKKFITFNLTLNVILIMIVNYYPVHVSGLPLFWLPFDGWLPVRWQFSLIFLFIFFGEIVFD